MGQIEVYEFLKRCRLCGDNDYKTIREIARETGLSVYVARRSVLGLWSLNVRCSYLESLDSWPRGFRLRKEYVTKHIYEYRKKYTNKGIRV